MKKRIAIHPETDNILKLEHPGQFRCRVVGYLLERSLFVIEVTDKQKLFYVVLPDVHYYDGTFLWQGANLRAASRDEQFDYMLNKSVVAALGILLIFEGHDCVVRILAGDWIAIFDDLPERFK